eukprot:1325712-Amorphochlora_amoeboformis.AAC.1
MHILSRGRLGDFEEASKKKKKRKRKKKKEVIESSDDEDDLQEGHLNNHAWRGGWYSVTFGADFGFPSLPLILGLWLGIRKGCGCCGDSIGRKLSIDSRSRVMVKVNNGGAGADTCWCELGWGRVRFRILGANARGDGGAPLRGYA